jgi:hypothetical protein
MRAKNTRTSPSDIQGVPALQSAMTGHLQALAQEREQLLRAGKDREAGRVQKQMREIVRRVLQLEASAKVEAPARRRGG